MTVVKARRRKQRGEKHAWHAEAAWRPITGLASQTPIGADFEALTDVKSASTGGIGQVTGGESVSTEGTRAGSARRSS